MSSMKHLVILDPGLNELGGHHPASLSSVRDALASRSDFALTVFCHRDYQGLPQEHDGNIKCVRHFNCRYYQFFYQMPTTEELQAYTQKLTREYQHAMLEVIQQADSTNAILFWCHSLNWEHASALSFAFQLVVKRLTPEQKKRIRLIVGLMYHPLRRASKEERALLIQKMHYQLAFKRLLKLSQVEIYAADGDIQSYCRKLFGQNLALQPCLLLGDIASIATTNHLAKDNTQALEKKRVLLFTGDAKENKGFLQLPMLAEQLASERPDIEFIAQYSISNDNVDIQSAANQLAQLAKRYPNMNIVDHFVTHQEMMDLFQQAQVVVLNYDQYTYRNQSSGVLWLAAYFGLTVISLSETWIAREAKRLGMSYIGCKNIEQCLSSLAHWQKPNINHQAPYYQALFRKIDDWLESQFRELSSSDTRL